MIEVLVTKGYLYRATWSTLTMIPGLFCNEKVILIIVVVVVVVVVFL